MPFPRERFLEHRPYLYHFTNAANVALLRRERAMLSAAAWIDRANAFQPGQVLDPLTYLGTARPGRPRLLVEENLAVVLNDQQPLLDEGAFYKLEDNCTVADFIRCLNGYVFFWPGKDEGPTPKGDLGKSFRKKYTAYGQIRILTAHIWVGGDSPIRFCSCNSGAPQWRDRLTRGPGIFKSHQEADFAISKVAEVVFPHRLALPESTEWKPPSETDWQPLFETFATTADGRPRRSCCATN